MDLITNYIILLATVYLTIVQATVYQSQQRTGNHASSKYVVGYQNHPQTTHFVAQKGGITYGQLAGSGRSNYGLQDNLNTYTDGRPLAQIPVLMVPVAQDFGLIYQAVEPYYEQPITQQRYANQQSGPVYASPGSSGPRFSSYYNVELVNMIYGRPRSMVIEQKDTQYDISRR
ncbi:uncharacterized protein LOC107368459 [Tetranychus urticae]|uniref:uncharacterized protein LOC107368459 n=1 Tax=Tetranychus urticae TaxID=32264 RepID=UPI00077BEB44|nr:uncharacterized protein LOC107368459 [Tetranychus urticae]